MSNLVKDKKLWINVGILIVISVFIFMYLNDPQCPEHYTHAQVDDSGCVVGANIGLGLALILLLPAALVALGLIIKTAYRRQQKPD